MDKRKIAIVAGGDSSEIVVSNRSAKGIYSFLDTKRYDAYIVKLSKNDWHVELPDETTVKIDKNDFSFCFEGKKHIFDFAYITIHGTPGENGLLQGYFDLIGMPYSSCGVLASALTFNKYICNHYLQSFGFPIAQSVLLRNGESISNEEVIEKIGLPCFIKPNVGGSSFGTTKVKENDQIQPAIQLAFKEGGEVIIESFMSGTEITCGCYKTREHDIVFPITEVISKNEFFDYEAKYTASKASEITPARLSQAITEKVQKMTSRIYDIIGCKGIIRVDYIIIGEEPYLLEVNTTPGMTETSFIPQQVKAMGIDIKEVMTDIIENELTHNTVVKR
ncbi:D-alanine--D-alanine ligase [Coprobacter secundus]|jgi:D-ala D-ala ligase N-terminal domain protein|uniref:D-alanine--D-alanine ligase n=1 Tax=Coprobacter secundus TaxID=1501392 RepID=UPI000573131C|nr:D-alanine--D-alanine ligase [Coprobacter secundus]KHM45007.1 D-alanine--D-alanine ligase [Coprobacter secundus]